MIAAPPLADPAKPANNPANATATFRAKALGDWGNGLQAQIRPMVGATMSILPSPAAGALAITALHQDVAGDHAQVVVPVRPGRSTRPSTTSRFSSAGHRFLASGAAVNAQLLTFTISPATA